MPYDGRRLYGVCCAEKGVFRFALRTHGVAGHASMPRMGDNALLKLAAHQFNVKRQKGRSGKEASQRNQFHPTPPALPRTQR